MRVGDGQARHHVGRPGFCGSHAGHHALRGVALNACADAGQIAAKNAAVSVPLRRERHGLQRPSSSRIRT